MLACQFCPIKAAVAAAPTLVLFTYLFSWIVCAVKRKRS